MLASPLNYTGGKYRLLPQILPLFPDNITCFVDLFCGGCNVGINVAAEKYIFNDISHPLIEMFSTMTKMGGSFLERIEGIIKEYGLSDTKTKGYSFYGCESDGGLADINRKNFTRLRSAFNSRSVKDDEYYVMLYVLIVYAFNNQIRFNRKGDFNLPPGKRDFNSLMVNKLESFIDFITTHQTTFTSVDFKEFEISSLSSNDFVYADPPYLITCATYNEQKGWTEQNEKDLLVFLDMLTMKKVRFALSNVVESKGNRNIFLYDWINNHPEYRVHWLNFSYNNSSYQRANKEKTTKEVLITNY